MPEAHHSTSHPFGERRRREQALALAIRHALCISEIFAEIILQFYKVDTG
jgi:hypothetical protein